MLKFALLTTVALSLTDCGPRRPQKPEPMAPILICPSWKDAAKGRKAKLADEIVAAPADAIWPDVLVADQKIDQPYCCDGRMCGCQGQSVHDMMKHFIRAMVKP